MFSDNAFLHCGATVIGHHRKHHEQHDWQGQNGLHGNPILQLLLLTKQRGWILFLSNVCKVYIRTKALLSCKHVYSYAYLLLWHFLYI